MVKPKIESAQTPEELQALIKEALERIEKLKVEEKESKQRAIAEAVGRAGADFEQKYGQYIAHKNRDNEIAGKMVKLLSERAEIKQYLVDQRKPILDTLVGLGVKEEYVQEALGEAPKAPAAKAAGVAGERAPRTHIVAPDGKSMTWWQMVESKGHSKGDLKKGSAHAFYLAKYKTLPEGYSEVEST